MLLSLIHCISNADLTALAESIVAVIVIATVNVGVEALTVNYTPWTRSRLSDHTINRQRNLKDAVLGREVVEERQCPLCLTYEGVRQKASP